MTLLKILAVLLVAITSLGDPRVAAAAWILDLGLGAVHESNVSLGRHGRDTQSDTALETSVSAGASTVVGDRHTASLTGDVAGTAWSRLWGLNNVSIGLSPAWKTKLGLGAAAPWIRLAGSVAHQQYDDDIRDGWRYRLGPSAGKRFADRWDVRAEYVYEERIADRVKRVSSRLPGDVFDLTSHTFAVRTDVLWTELVSVSGGYAWRDGEVVSTTRRNPEIVSASTAITRDRTFGSNRFAYKIDATVHILSVGMSVVLTRQSSFTLGYERHIGQARGGLDYGNDVVRAGLLYSY